MAKKDTASDWKDWVLGKRGKKTPEGGEFSPQEGRPEPESGPPESSAQTMPPAPPELPTPENLQGNVDEVLGMDPQPEPQVPPPCEPAPPKAEPPREPESRAEPAPAPPRPEVAPPSPGYQAEPRTPGATRLPKDLFAHLALVDIGGGMRQARELPRFFPLKRTRTLAGRHVRAHIHLDDEATVRPEHARILYEERDGQPLFIIDPTGGGPVAVNGITVHGGGAVLASGDLITIGSAALIFYQTRLKA